jgi:hypothetical protein
MMSEQNPWHEADAGVYGLEYVGQTSAPVFTPEMIEAIYAAWHGAGVDIAGGDWKRFVGMLPKEK